MSIRNMQLRMSRHLRIVLYVVIGVFIVGLPALFVPQLGGGGQQAEGPEDVGKQVVARVNGVPVERVRVDEYFDQTMAGVLPFYASMGQPVSFDQIWPERLRAFEQAIVEGLLVEQAKAEGLSVSGKEVKARAEQIVDRNLEQMRSDYSGEQLEMELARLVWIMFGRREERLSERDFREIFIDTLTDEPERLEAELLVSKLQQVVVGSVSVTEQDLLGQYDRATVRQIQVLLHPEGEPARTDEEARKRAAELAARARKGGDFAALARAESDDPGARESGGLIESVGRGMMPKEWDDAVFALGIEEVSDPIELTGGYAVVKMEKLERELPEDFESNREELLSNLVSDRKNSVWAGYQRSLREKAEVEVLDPELLAWQAMAEGRLEDALPKLEEATSAMGRRKGLVAATVFYQLGALREAGDDWEAALEAYESGYDSIAGAEMEPPGGRETVLMSMARCYEQLGDAEEALEWYRTAGDTSELPSVHDELAMIYERLGKADLAASEREWLEEYQEVQLERQKQMEAMREAEEGQDEGGGGPGSR